MARRRKEPRPLPVPTLELGFATVPMPHVDESITESMRALDELSADGVVLLANNAGTYVGQEGQDALWDALNDRSAVVFVHPAELPGPTVPGVLRWATATSLR